MSANLSARLAALATRYTAIEHEIQRLISTTNNTNTTNNSNAHPSTSAPAQVTDPLTITALQPCSQDTREVADLRAWCLQHEMYATTFQWVPSDYYQRSLQWRRDILSAPSINFLCKTILLENTHCVHDDCHDPNNARYYLIVYPYVERFDAEMVMRVVKELNPGMGKKKFNFRLANPETSQRLTGFSHGAVAPFGTVDASVPVILSSVVMKLSPSYFWLGGGHVDCKVRVDVDEFVRVVKPIVASITVPLTAEELEQIID